MVFQGDIYWALTGMILWGIGMGAQESVLKASIANVIPLRKRATAFGLFNAGFGIFWFIGSAVMGRLYDLSINYLVIFSLITQALAILTLWLVSFIQTEKEVIG
jgi:predicted MFS family arabinose efflux permease